tara:strand:- start:5140 stop:5862 length:723 start_codon:yes stop_codon:yes gene_type:complete
VTRVVYLGGKAPGAAGLKILLKMRDDLDIDLIGVGASQRDGGVSEIASDAGIPLIATPDDIPACDILISLQYDKILKARHIERAGEIAVNLHFAPLPEYRGCNQFSLAILDDRKEFGVTLHELDEGIDSGSILFERRFPIPEGIWVDQLHALALEHANALFAASLPALIKGEYEKRPQETLFAERGEPRMSYRKEIDALKQIDLSQPGNVIDRSIRATAMPGFAPPYAIVAGERIDLVRS